MSDKLAGFALAAFLCGSIIDLASSACAQQADHDASLFNQPGVILWLGNPDAKTSKDQQEKAVDDIAGDFRKADKSNSVETIEYPAVGVIVLFGITPATAAQLLAHVRASQSKPKGNDDDLFKLFKLESIYLENASITSDFKVTLQDNGPCDDDTAQDVTGKIYPPNVLRVWNSAPTATPALPAPTTGRAWVIDSGIDKGVTDATPSKAYVWVDSTNAANCNRLVFVPVTGGQFKVKCDTAGWDRDRLGHGTMISGIIAGKFSAATNAGVVGVAPGATVIPVKVFGNSPQTDFKIGPLAGLAYVKEQLVAAVAAHQDVTKDVVNVSWGVNWIDYGVDGINMANGLNDVVKGIADTGAKVVIAAGNADTARRPAWLQFVAPADTSGYLNGNGRIYAVAATQITFSGGNWTDEFAALSNYGLGYPGSPSREVIAEPGDDTIIDAMGQTTDLPGVQGLWPTNNKPQYNICGGTSFAAAHLSGLLMQVNSLNTSSNVTSASDPLLNIGENSVTTYPVNNAMSVGTIVLP